MKSTYLTLRHTIANTIHIIKITTDWEENVFAVCKCLQIFSELPTPQHYQPHSNSQSPLRSQMNPPLRVDSPFRRGVVQSQHAINNNDKGQPVFYSPMRSFHARNSEHEGRNFMDQRGIIFISDSQFRIL